MTVQAHDQKLSVWYGKIQRGEIKLPRFQRPEAWDRGRIGSLLEMVIRDLPLGITLVLQVGAKEKFESRYLVTAPQTNGPVYEQLLDGQQRLTALWRAFQNNYTSETYYVYLGEFDRYDKDEEREDMSIYWRGRYKKNEEHYPQWCDDPAECLRRGMIPTHLLKPEDIQGEIDIWIEQAAKPLEPQEGGKEEWRNFYEFQKRMSDRLKDLRVVVANYNLPYLSLPPQTDKAVALSVFIKMNTNSKPLSTYDIIVAEVENVTETSLHDLQAGLKNQYPEVAGYSPLPDLILPTSSLLQGYPPNQHGAWSIDVRKMVEQWSVMVRGLNRMANFLKGEGICDEQRLPTNAVLAVIAALYADIPVS